MSESATKVDGVVITPASLTLVEGEVAEVIVQVEPSDVSQSVRYEVLTTGVVKVKADGVNDNNNKRYIVTALKDGDGEVTFTSSADKNVVGKLTVYVKVLAEEETEENSEEELSETPADAELEELTEEGGEPTALSAEEAAKVFETADVGNDTEAPPPEETLTASQHAIRDALNLYVDNMGPTTPMTPEVGATYQLRLFRAIMQLTQLQGYLFVTEMDNLLKVINEHRTGPFSERYVFRFYEQMQISQSDRLAFSRLMNLFITVAKPETRQMALKRVDLVATVQSLKSGDAQQRLIEYFGATE